MKNYFTNEELIKTDTGLYNTPPPSLDFNKGQLRIFLNIVRREIDMPIIVNSAYRSAVVNKAVGGSPTSKHLEFLAADVTCSDMNKLNKVLRRYRAMRILSELIEHSTYTHFAI